MGYTVTKKKQMEEAYLKLPKKKLVAIVISLREKINRRNTLLSVYRERGSFEK